MLSYSSLMKRKALMERKALYEAWERSGLTKAKFCRQNNVAKRSFFKWIKQIQNNDNDDTLNTISDVNTVDDRVNLETDSIKFLKVSHAASQKSSSLEPGSLEISLSNGAVIRAAISQDNINYFLQEIIKNGNNPTI